ncbi:carbohydrate sulfotransferase 11-like [Oculina patagonica]
MSQRNEMMREKMPKGEERNDFELPTSEAKNNPSMTQARLETRNDPALSTSEAKSSPTMAKTRLNGNEAADYKGGEAGKRDLEQKQQLRHFCENRKHKEPSEEGLKHLFVFEKYKLMFCLVPKVATRQWMPLLGGPGAYGPTVNQFPSEKAQQMLQNFYKFMFVREPFERLLSAYKDKYVHPRPVDKDPYITVYGRKIIQNFRPNASKADLQSGYGVKWPEFVEYIVNGGEKEDWHWKTYEDICGFCDIKYDFIGHYENLEEDSKYVLEQANLTQLKFPKVLPAKTKDELVQYYSQIPKDWIKRLWNVYQGSFEAFGYPFPGPLANLLGSS